LRQRTPNASEPNVNGVFTVTRTGSTAAPLDVTYLISGTATSGVDFTPLPGTVTIPACSPSVTITVAVLDDPIVEVSETVVLTLAVGSYTIMIPSAATVTIGDDDVAGFTVTPALGHTKEDGTSTTFTVALNTQPTADVTIPLASSNPAKAPCRRRASSSPTPTGTSPRR
jgi:hypothetical protein